MVNSAGAFAAPEQASTERRFRQTLAQRWGIVFRRLYVFGNVPLGRFKDWLLSTGGYEEYMRRLTEGFNPQALAGVMCQGLVSLAWDGQIYDCDFNQAANQPLGGHATHASQMEGARRQPPRPSPWASTATPARPKPASPKAGPS